MSSVSQILFFKAKTPIPSSNGTVVGKHSKLQKNEKPKSPLPVSARKRQRPHSLQSSPQTENVPKMGTFWAASVQILDKGKATMVAKSSTADGMSCSLTSDLVLPHGPKVNVSASDDWG
ncbi:hypothetical protein PIB30_018920 [Stylosanthes scabra]|uniref:Uncharacterized protein n=1 Tax=Stylosanthes scabra TaxID=79078 RepID=A0ABU6X7R5_9FABA|nr:hypothetical protein [Stylosanthes scabra]